MKITLIRVIVAMGALLTALTGCRSEYRSSSVEWIKSKDLRTGNEIWQITSHDSISEAFYFYVSSVTSDDKYVIFRSKRSGGFDIYRSNLINGEITRLTDEGIKDACIHSDGKNMVYISGWKYYKMNVQTMERELVLDFTGKLPSKPAFRPSLTNDGRYTIVFTRQNDTNSLYRVNLETKEILKVMEQAGGSFSHQLINPADPDLITYNPLPDTQNDNSLPMEKRPRTRIINIKKGTNEPFLITPYGLRATHDSWSSGGDRYYFFEKNQKGWIPASVGSIDLNGDDYTRHYTNDTIKLGHGTISRDTRWFISDGQKPDDNPLILINLQDKKGKIICWPDASVDPPANVHVHPNFSSSGNFIIYTSDVVKTGTHQVYVVPIKVIKDSWHL